MDSLHCPNCGSNLGKHETPGILQCEGNKHKFDMKQLIGAQSARVVQLLSSAVVLLNQQAGIIQFAIQELAKYPEFKERMEYLIVALMRTDELIVILTELSAQRTQPEKPALKSEDVPENTQDDFRL